MKSIRLAEWVSLGLSTLLIATVVVYLAFGISREGDEYVDIKVEIATGKARESAGKTILPVLITNESNRPAKNVKIKAGEVEVDIDYLPAKAVEHVYLVLPKGDSSQVKAEALSYEVER